MISPCVIVCFTATSPGGRNHTSVQWEGAAQNITYEDKVTLFRGIYSSPTCLPMSVSEFLHFCFLSALILLSHKAQPWSCRAVLWLAQGHDSARVCCWICCSHHITKCRGNMFLSLTIPADVTHQKKKSKLELDAMLSVYSLSTDSLRLNATCVEPFMMALHRFHAALSPIQKNSFLMLHFPAI